MDETTIPPEGFGDAMPGTPANESTPPAGSPVEEAEPISTPGLDPRAPNEAEGGPEDAGNPRELPSLPPQYATGGELGFFTRTTETVPTAQTVGPDGALYIAELTGLPYPEGYARVLRVEDPGDVAGFDGEGGIPGGKATTYASGFDQIHSLAFDDEGSLFVLEYQNSSEVYDPTVVPSELPPSTLVKVGEDGSREIISGEELKLANYIVADPETGDIYATVNNTEVEDGQVLRYSQNDEGAYDVEVVADGLESPRGIRFGPDGNLYVLEQGQGTPPEDPNYEEAPTVQLIPGLVSQRGGYSGAITRIDSESGEAERIFEGLPSFQEFNPQTGEDRVFGVGVRGFDIADDGTVWIASGGGLSNATAAAAGVVGQDLRGLLELEGLFGDDPSEAVWTEKFDAVSFAGQFGPDGATTLFNTQSNLNDVSVGPDGDLYAVDAARNVLYQISGEDGETVESVTVLQKRPPVLTPPQYASVLANGGEPSLDYRVEINEVTFKGANALPDTPGRQLALAFAEENGIEIPSGGGNPFDPSQIPPRGEDGLSNPGQAGVPGDFGDLLGGQPPADLDQNTPIEGGPLPVGVDPGDVVASGDAVPSDLLDPGPDAPTTTPDGTPINYIDGGDSDSAPGNQGIDSPTEGGPPNEDIQGFDPIPPDQLSNVPGPVADGPLLPGPVDPVSPPVLEGNYYAPWFAPFFGDYAPAEGDEPLLGDEPVDQLFVFGDRATEDGGEFGKRVEAALAGFDLPIDQAPYSPFGNFTDGLNWTTYLGRILGVDEGTSPDDPDGDVGFDDPDTNFSYLDATARELVNPFDPVQPFTGLTDFAGQIDAFEEVYGGFSSDDLVVVSFGGNDLTLPPAEGQSPMDAAAESIQATIDGIARLASLGAEKFLVPNVVDVEIVPIFSDPEFAAQFGPPGALTAAVEAYNAALEGVLGTIEETTDLDVTLLDINGLFENIVAEPGAYGFLNTDEPVLITPPNVDVAEPVYNPAIVGQDPAVQHSTLFLDVLFSPTALAQSLIAETARDALLGDGGASEPNLVMGTAASEALTGTEGDDVIDGMGGRFDRLEGLGGADVFVLAGPDGERDRTVIRDYEVGVDSIRLDGAVVEEVRETDRGVLLRFEGDGDLAFVRGEGVTADTLVFQGDDLLV